MEVENFLGYYALGIQRLAGERSESCAMIKDGAGRVYVERIAG